MKRKKTCIHQIRRKNWNSLQTKLRHIEHIVECLFLVLGQILQRLCIACRFTAAGILWACALRSASSSGIEPPALWSLSGLPASSSYTDPCASALIDIWEENRRQLIFSFWWKWLISRSWGHEWWIIDSFPSSLRRLFGLRHPCSSYFLPRASLWSARIWGSAFIGRPHNNGWSETLTSQSSRVFL